MTISNHSLTVESLASLGHEPVDLWLSCHGYESRSVAHLEHVGLSARRMISYGFDFPTPSTEEPVGRRILAARERLIGAGFTVIVANDTQFDESVRAELQLVSSLGYKTRVLADISSMSRSRIASLLLNCAATASQYGCDLDIVYFPSSFDTHKHTYEPLEYFGPCHGRIAGWPDDPDLPLSLLIGLGTEPRRADGVVEMLEPDILALYVPLGDDDAYLQEIQRENRRVLEVGGQPDMYSLRDPRSTYLALRATSARLSARSRLVIVPLGPKVFCALAIAAAQSIGPQVGVWKASAGKGVQAIDVCAGGNPVIARISYSAHHTKDGHR